jgi:hypothetical protein
MFMMNFNYIGVQYIGYNDGILTLIIIVYLTEIVDEGYTFEWERVYIST